MTLPWGETAKLFETHRERVCDGRKVSDMLSIGELSRATALTVKTLRHYHERGVLVPTFIDPNTGYRYYDDVAVERSRVIKSLRELEFSLDDIAEILAECSEDADAVAFLIEQRDTIAKRLAHLRSVASTIDAVILIQKEKSMENANNVIEEKTIPAQLVAGIRMKGRFEDSSTAFKKLGRAFGFGLAGKAGMLIYDAEYRDEDADFEPFFPVKKAKKTDADIHVRELPSVVVLCLRHVGPYDGISQSYGRLLSEIRKRGAVPTVPSREVYLKGPGMLFKGNPQKYVTEIQIPVESS